MNHIIIGTAGHVDHGKTTLIKYLTGIDTDRLLEEKKRGITIELGFAYMTLENGEKIGIVDVPGHEKFIRHMLAGVGGIDIALFVVDANEGVMPQTLEHLEILQLLNVKKGVIALTKADLASSEWLEMVTEDVKEAFCGTFLEDAKIIPVSAYNGFGMDTLVSEILYLSENLPKKNIDRFPRLAIDRSFTIKGSGNVITGTLTQGTINLDDHLMLYPKEEVVKVRNIEVHGEKKEQAFAGQRVALNLTYSKKINVERGDVLASENSLTTTKEALVHISVAKNTLRKIKNNSTIHFFSGTFKTVAKIIFFDTNVLSQSESAFAKLKFEEPIALCFLDKFILRFFSPVETVGGGVVLNTVPFKIDKSKINEILQALYSADFKTSLNEFVKINCYKYEAIDFYKNITGLSFSETREILLSLKNKQIYLLNDEIPLSMEFVEKTIEKIKKYLNVYHEQNPMLEGVEYETFKSRMFPSVHEGAVLGLVKYFSNKNIINVSEFVKLYDFTPKKNQSESSLSDYLEKIYLEEKYAVLGKNDLIESLKDFDKKTCSAVFDSLVKSGKLKHIDGQAFLHIDVYEATVTSLKNYFENHKAISLAEFRDLIGSSRKVALMILEHFDRKKITKKIGDARVLV